MFDILFSLVVLIVFSIPLLIVFLIVKLTSKGPALHMSKRVGQNSSLFLMPKFRTMTVAAPQLATHLFHDADSYLTPVGGFLRKSSLDELPQIFSVLSGEMSVVGPRPALFNQDDLIDLRKSLGIDRIKPGITGWAQINGRDELSIAEKVQYDLYYLNHASLLFDLKIIAITALKVLFKKNVHH